MADPILPNVIRYQAVLRSRTGLPEDRMVNTFAMLWEPTVHGDFETAASDGIGHLDAFYFNAHGTNPISTYLSNELLGAIEFRAYDLSLAPPRFPYIENSIGILPTAGNSLPSEVAAVLSWVSEQNSPRNRGRIYLGPLGDNALTRNANEQAIVNPTFLADLVAAGDFLNGFDLATDGQAFGIISQVDAAFKITTGGWVDNAFDTQRRRGGEATSRTTFGTYLGQ